MIKRFSRLLDNFFVVLFIWMIIISFLQVFFRYVLRSPLFASEEIARLIGVWLYFLGATLATKNKEHIFIDILYIRVSPKFQKVFDLISDVLVLIFHVFLVVEGAKHAYLFRGFESHALRFSMTFFFAALPLTAFFSLIFLVQSIVDNSRELKG